MKKITESMIKESIEQNMDEFRSKALKGNVSGEDVANLFGYGDLYKEGLKEEQELNEIKELVIADMNKEQLNEEEDNTDNNKENEKTNNTEEKHLEDGETTTLNNFKEFFERTNSKININKVGSEPSPLFGNNTNNHNKFKVTITNDKGRTLSWNYWDSEKNTKQNTTPSIDTVMKDFGLKLESVVVGISFDNFKKQFGYDEIEDTIAQKQYEALRRVKDEIKQMYPNEHNVYQIIQLAKKI